MGGGGGAEDQDQALLTKSTLDISLVPESEDDKKFAALMKYSVAECKLFNNLLLASRFYASTID